MFVLSYPLATTVTLTIFDIIIVNIISTVIMITTTVILNYCRYYCYKSYYDSNNATIMSLDSSL